MLHVVFCIYRMLICLLSFTCMVSIRRGFLFLFVLGMGCVVVALPEPSIELFCMSRLLLLCCVDKNLQRVPKKSPRISILMAFFIQSVRVCTLQSFNVFPFLLVPTSCFMEGLVLTGVHIPLISIACISFLNPSSRFRFLL